MFNFVIGQGRRSATELWRINHPSTICRTYPSTICRSYGAGGAGRNTLSISRIKI